jgi:hypothetical protein
MVNSPTKPFRPGRPIEDRATISVSAAYTGITFHSPPKASMSRVWRRS